MWADARAMGACVCGGEEWPRGAGRIARCCKADGGDARARARARACMWTHVRARVCACVVWVVVCAVVMGRRDGVLRV